MARRTKEEAEGTREAIIEAAIDTFLDKGVAKSSLDQIARNAGVTRGAVYWHFKDKEDLLNTLINRVRLPMHELLDDLRELHTDNPLTALHDGTCEAVMMLKRSDLHRRVCTILFTRCELIGHHAPNFERQRQLDTQTLAKVTADFEKAARLGLLRPGVSPRIAALTMFTQIKGVYLAWLQDPDRFDLEQEGVAMLDLLFNGLKASP